MQKRSRRRFSAAFKAQVVLEALSERQSLEELARKHELHPTQISTWRKEFVANAAAAFGGKAEGEGQAVQEAQLEKLYAQIGQQKVEIDFLKKKLR
jgi:transposase